MYNTDYHNKIITYYCLVYNQDNTNLHLEYRLELNRHKNNGTIGVGIVTTNYITCGIISLAVTPKNSVIICTRINSHSRSTTMVKNSLIGRWN